jgi:Subtilase family
MAPGRLPHRRWALPLAVTVAVACAPASPAAAATVRPGAGDLSARLAELAKPSVRTAPSAVQARKLSVARTGPGSLLRRGNRILAYVRFEGGALTRIGSLRRGGAQIVDASRRYQTVTVAVRPVDLHELAAVPGVAGVTQALVPQTTTACPVGDVVSEGVQQLNAGEGEPGGEKEARSAFDVDGGGIDVGILSDSFDQATEAADGSGPVATHAEEDEESGDLPGPNSPCPNKAEVDILENGIVGPGEDPPADEGRAMAQIVHDVAPGASLDFASAFNGELSFANNIEELAEAGAEVIVDDVFYFEEPFFQDGPVAVAVNEMVGDGAAYFSAAGNANIVDAEGRNIGSWETAPFRDSGGCPAEVQSLSGANGTHCLDLHPGAQIDRTFGIKVEPDTVLTVDLQWAEPWFGVGTDMDAFLLHANGTLIAAAEDDNVNVSQRPVEILQWENTSSSQQTVQLVVNRFAGTNPRVKFVLFERGPGVAATEYPRSTGEGPVALDVVGPTVVGHSGAASAIATAAIRFNTTSEPEKYSSRGPARHDFDPVNGVTPAAPIAPEIISKPDITATDCNLTTFFAFFMAGQGWRFCGTSAAAPHAAGVAALMLDEEAAATPAEIRAALQESADPVGAFGPCAVGAGLVEAVGAIEALLSPPGTPPDSCEVPASEASVEEARAGGNWGSETPPPPSPPSSPTGPVVNPPVVDTKRPRTFFRRHPSKVVRTRGRRARVVFRFGSNEEDVTFVCRIDGGLSRFCDERLVRRFPLGKHTVKVKARDAAGNVDRTPAVYRFEVKRMS